MITCLNELKTRLRLHEDVFTHKSFTYTKTQLDTETHTNMYVVCTHMHSCTHARTHACMHVHKYTQTCHHLFLSLHHFKGSWTVMTQTVPLLGHNHYNSCPFLLLPCHFKGLWTVTAPTMILSLLDNHYDSAHDPSLVTNIYKK